MTVALIVIAALLVVLLVWAVLTYNRFVSLRVDCREGLSEIDVQLKRRHDLIPNLVETVRGYATHERETLEEVTRARAGAVDAAQPGDIEGRAQAEGALSAALGRLFAVAEAYPDLKANQNFLELQRELSATEDKLAAARRFYNNTVEALNEGVVAHEISHIRNYDVRLLTFAAVLAGSIALLADLMLRMLFFGGSRDRRGSNPLLMVAALAAIVLAPIAATVIQMAISRRREFLADASAAELTRYPQGLASALRVISGTEIRTSRPSAAIAHMYIHAPLGERNRLTRGLFSTHPPIEQRTGRLDELANGVRHVRRGRARSEAMARLLGES